jgi:hypothetical protein
MMALKMVAAVLDEVPEALREYYTQDGDKFVLQAVGIDDHPSVSNLRNAYREEQEKRKRQGEKLAEAEGRLKEVPEDFDAERWAILKDHDPDKIDPDKMRQEIRLQMERKHKAEIEKLKEQMGQKDVFLERIVKQDRLREALINGGANKDLIEGAMALLLPKVQVKQDGEDFVDVVDTDMGPMGIKDYTAQWLQGPGAGYVAPAGGPDLKGSRGNNAVRNPWSKEHFNLTEQARLMQTDRAKAERLAAAAKST